jgi:hypothetical protein
VLKRVVNSEQLQLLRRLRFAGCPIDSEHLPQPLCPLRDFRQAGVQGTNIIPIAGGFGIILGVKALACAALTVCQFDLRANWFKEPISWIKPCDEHPNRYCFRQRSGDHTVWSSDDVLTGRTRLLRRGEYLQGRLFGALHESLSAPLGKTLEATLSIADLAGNECQFSVSLLNGMLETVVGQPTDQT